MAKAHETLADNLNKFERAALMSAPSNRIGVSISKATATDVRRELWVLGLIGRSGGLTVKGSIVREILDERSYAQLGL